LQRVLGPILPKPADVSTLTAPPATGGLTWSSPSLDHEGVCLRDGLQPLQTPQTTAKSVLKTMAERIGRQKRGKRAPPSVPQGIWRSSSPMPSIISPIGGVRSRVEALVRRSRSQNLKFRQFSPTFVCLRTSAAPVAAHVPARGNQGMCDLGWSTPWGG